MTEQHADTSDSSPKDATSVAQPTRHKRLHLGWIRARLGPNGRRITQLHDQLDGALAIAETAFLYNAAAGARTIVEIGSFRGKSTVLMALGSRTPELPAGARITAIDPHRPEDSPRHSDHDFNVFHQTLSTFGVAEQVTHQRVFSHDARQRYDATPIDVLFVDGDHSYEAAKQDFEDWAPLVKPGGIIAAHDTFRARFPGVLPAWNETVDADPSFGPTQRVRSIAWAQRLHTHA